MDIEDVIAQIREVAQGSGSLALLNDEVVVLISWIKNMKAENADLRDRLDAQGQHPGFPRLQPTQEMVEDWLPFVENVYEIIDRSIERMLTLDLDDPDEPVAGTA